jgi:RNA polymerase-binding protein DksA
MATSPLDLNMFREQLERQRAELSAELTQLHDETTNVNQQEGYGVKNHPAEDASELFSRERNIGISDGLQDELNDVEQALQRIQDGTYGLCQVCGEQISLERLEARPAATFCIRHQREREDQSTG